MLELKGVVGESGRLGFFGRFVENKSLRVVLGLSRWVFVGGVNLGFELDVLVSVVWSLVRSWSS